MIKISGIVNDSIVDGPGFRLAIFTQGCSHNCPGCHNPQTHDFEGGYYISVDEILDKIKKNPLLDGITLSGGDPFEQAKELIPLVKEVKEMGLSIVAYTGYTWEQLMADGADKDMQKLLKECDILIDGPFVLAKKSLMLTFRGSSNQRVIDVKESLKKNEIVVMDVDNI